MSHTPDGKSPPARSFLSGAFHVAGGTAAAQLLFLVTSPLLTRLFSPNELGVFSVFLSAHTVLAAVACLRLDAAIPVAKAEVDAWGLLKLACQLAIGLGLIVASARYWLPASVGAKEPFLTCARYSWLLGLATVGAGLTQASRSMATRLGLFSAIGRLALVQAITRVGVQLLAGFAAWSSTGLLAGYAVAQLTGNVALWRSIQLRRPQELPRPGRVVFRDYLDFPITNTLASICTMVGLSAPIFLFGSMVSVEAAGFFGLTLRVLGLPLSLLAQSLAQVFLSQASELRRQELPTRHLVLRLASIQIILGAPIFLSLLIQGPQMFSMVFGPSWTTAGKYAQVMAPAYFLSFLVTALASIPLIHRRQRMILVITVVECVARLAAVYFGVSYGSDMSAVVAFSACGLVIYGSYLVWILTLSGIRLRELLGRLRFFFASLFPVLAVAVALRGLLPHLQTVSVFLCGSLLVGHAVAVWHKKALDLDLPSPLMVLNRLLRSGT